MICYLIRHGKDDETIRGGWSQHPLTDEGIRFITILAENFAGKMDVKRIYTSDLCRAAQTAQIVADRMDIPVIPLSCFREVNNGALAGMKNSDALERYPGLFWNRLGWQQCYPGGESPEQFYERIFSAWSDFSNEIVSVGESVALVTHGGVIHVIRSILENRQYSNRDIHRPVKHGEVIALTYDGSVWKER